MHLFLSLLDRLPGISGLAVFPLSFKPFKYCSTDWVKFLKFLIYLSQLCQCTNEVILDLLEELVSGIKRSHYNCLVALIGDIIPSLRGLFYIAIGFLISFL